MFHSNEERNRNIEPLTELQYSYETKTTNETKTSTCTFELGQITPCDFDSIEFDLDCDFGREDSWGRASFGVAESQCVTTFTPEDKWPI
jgi:hypothetical protein